MATSKKKITVKKKAASAKAEKQKSATASDTESIDLKGKRLVRASDAKSRTGLKPKSTQTGAIVSSRTVPVVDPDQEKKFKFFCVWCAQKLSAYEHWRGRDLPCPSCHARIQIPDYPPGKIGDD